MTKIEIINETVEFYSNNPRALDNSLNYTRCMYLTSEGTKCAFGRCMTEMWLNNPKVSQGASVVSLLHVLEIFPTIPTGLDHLNIIVEAPLQEKYWGHTVEFWNEIQTLHDYEGFWNQGRLSESGEKRVARLKDKYK